MKISQKGLYGLQALMVLARRHSTESIPTGEVAREADVPEKFLELILLELKNARIVESVRGAKGGYRLRRAPEAVRLSEVVRLIDGPLAPFGDAERLGRLIERNDKHRALYEVFMAIRNAAAEILDNTTLADLVAPHSNARNSAVGGQEIKAGVPSLIGEDT